jgi:cyanophycinase
MVDIRPLMRISALLIALVTVPAALVAQGTRSVTVSAAPAPAGFGGKWSPRPPRDGAVRVGPVRGTVIVVGGGAMGPEIYQAFIDAAGGPDALILDVPNAGGLDSLPANVGRGWREAGARNVAPLFTRDRAVAEGTTFTAPIDRAGGIWFEGGRQFHLVQDYGGTRTERAIDAVLARGGVIGGSSAGASILGDFMVRGAPSNDNSVMDYPGYERGFGYLRNVGIDQHVVARSRLPDLADSIITRYPALLAISADEGTAWVIRGDTGRIVGRNKAFVYHGTTTDAGAPFLTLYPGDRYDLNARRVIARAADRSPVPPAMLDAMFARYTDAAAGSATVLVARDGDVFVDRAYGVPAQPRFMPRTTLPLFDLGDIAGVFSALCAQLPERPARRPGSPDASARQECVTRVSAPIGMHQTLADSTAIRSNVDELYRLSLGLESAASYRGADPAKGWTVDRFHGATRYTASYDSEGRRAAFMRVPERHAAVIILTNDDRADARGMAEQLLGRLIPER